MIDTSEIDIRNVESISDQNELLIKHSNIDKMSEDEFEKIFKDDWKIFIKTNAETFPRLYLSSDDIEFYVSETDATKFSEWMWCVYKNECDKEDTKFNDRKQSLSNGTEDRLWYRAFAKINNLLDKKHYCFKKLNHNYIRDDRSLISIMYSFLYAKLIDEVQFLDCLDIPKRKKRKIK
jgi:hypothetical protein